MVYNFAILTASDRCHSGERVDTSGPLLKKLIGEDDQFVVKHYVVVPDDLEKIKDLLELWSKQPEIHCVITNGGTGLTERDCTPEATEKVIQKDVPGICHALLSTSLKNTPMAMLSRLKCGISNDTLIINFPGSEKACKECYPIIKPVLKHALDQINGKLENVDRDHLTFNSNQSKVKMIPASQRNRNSPYKMVEIEEALELISKNVIEYTFSTREIRSEEFHLGLNHFLARSVFAKDPLPPFDASIKDGYAVDSSNDDEERKVLNQVSHPGNQSNRTVKGPVCVRISTGAPLPSGADAVVQVEDTEVIKVDENQEELSIKILHLPEPTENVRLKGSDIPVDPNNPIVKRFSKLDAINLGLIASTGVDKIIVYRRPTVAILSTGDELVPPGQSRPPNCIWDSNRTLLRTLLWDLGFTVIDLGISPDIPDSLFSHLKRGFQLADVMITTGGVSMGERDFMKQVLKEDFNAEIHFGRVNLKPGLPTTFATTKFDDHTKFIFSLPGNPVSAFVTFKLFVQQALHLLSGECFGLEKSGNPFIISSLTFRAHFLCKIQGLEEPYRLGSRPELLRAHVSFDQLFEIGYPIAQLTDPNQISSRLLSVRNANAFLLPKEDSKYLKDGAIVTAIMW